MITLVYASRAARAMNDDDLEALLESARDRNGTADVTGMLIYAQDSFLQQLEGDDEVVDETFSRIEADDRHTAIRVLSRRTIAERRFPQWSMGFSHPDGDSLRERIPGFQPPGDAPLVSAELVEDAEIAEALLGLYALGH